MRTIEIENGVEKNVTIYDTNREFAGYGHYKLMVDLQDEEGNKKTFKKTTTDMEFIDSLFDMQLEGSGADSINEAIYDKIETDIKEEVIEWLRSDK